VVVGGVLCGVGLCVSCGEGFCGAGASLVGGAQFCVDVGLSSVVALL
jgi:hypothetical protein